MQGTGFVPSRNRGLGFTRLLQGASLVQFDVGIELRIQPADSFEMMPNDFDGGDLFLANQIGDGKGRKIMNFRHSRALRRTKSLARAIPE